MKVLIDMQPAQGSSWQRGIGRFTRDFTETFIAHAKGADVHLLFNGLLPNDAVALRRRYRKILPERNLHVWEGVAPLAVISNPPEANSAFSGEVYQKYILSLQPDILIIPNLFEGWLDNSIIELEKLKGKVFLACVVHDFIPYNLNGGDYTKREYAWYLRQLEKLKYFDLIFADSENTLKDAAKIAPEIPGVATMCGASEIFRPGTVKIGEKSVIASTGINRPFILSVSSLDPRKNFEGLLAAYTALPENLRNAYQLVIPSATLNEARKRKLLKPYKSSKLPEDAILFPDKIDDAALVELYRAASLFVFPSFVEGFGLPVLEAMACGAPAICSKATSLPEVAPCPEALFDPANISDIAAKMEKALTDAAFASLLREKGREKTQSLTWENTAIKAWEALKNSFVSWNKEHLSPKETMATLADCWLNLPKRPDPEHAARSLARTFNESHKPQLLVDITELADTDRKSGIQRVVRSIGQHLKPMLPPNYALRFVVANPGKGSYAYADFAGHKIFSQSEILENGAAVSVGPGDIFLGLDLVMGGKAAPQSWFTWAMACGMKSYFVIYDLVPVLLPDTYPTGLVEAYKIWIKDKKDADGLICISQSVTKDLKNWLSEQNSSQKDWPEISWFHLGCDLENSLPSKGLPKDAPEILAKLKSGSTILMVGSIEPRKNHKQALAAFEQLWEKGSDVKLVIVAQNTWESDDFLKTLENHPEAGKRLFYLPRISDEYLERIYQCASAMLMASKAEGFGLPIIEAARRNVPLILRDLPVFQEIAGDKAFYFSGYEPEDLAKALQEWLNLYKKGEAPSSKEIPRLTWEQSCAMLVEKLPFEKEAN